jgi:hypothetical protein
MENRQTWDQGGKPSILHCYPLPNDFLNNSHTRMIYPKSSNPNSEIYAPFDAGSIPFWYSKLLLIPLYHHSIPILLNFHLFTNHSPGITLAPRAVMHDLVRENITINAEMIMTHLARISPTLTHALYLTLRWLSNLLRFSFASRNFWESGQAWKTCFGFSGQSPGDFNPVSQGEEVVIRARQMGGENQG